jgi:hypothetical protein
MKRRLRVQLRRRWSPAPGWPPAPVGFLPADDWSPDPTWAPAPEGWTGWRTHRGRLIAAAILAAVAVLCVFGALKSASDANRHAALANHGVTTLARVGDSSYDSGAGDPGGWSTDDVTFTDGSGQAIAVTVGHHYDDSAERATGHLTVIYNPTHPTTAMSMLDYQNDPSAGEILIGVVLAALFGATAIGFLISALKFTLVRTTRRRGLLTA